MKRRLLVPEDIGAQVEGCILDLETPGGVWLADGHDLLLGIVIAYWCWHWC